MAIEALIVGDRPLRERRSLRPALLAAAFAMASMALPAMAQESAPALSQDVPSSGLGVWTSKDGESKDDFARRVGAAAHAFTEASGFEACGAIMQENGGTHFRLALATNQSQVGCMVLSLDQPGYSDTGETLHTHPDISSFTPNAVDAQMFHAYIPNRGRYPVDGTKFSDLDFDSGSGYVVASSKGPFGKPRILYQNGRNTTRDLGKVATYSLADLTPDRETFLRDQPVLASQDPATPLPAHSLGVATSRKAMP